MPEYKAYDEFERSYPVKLTNGDTLTITYNPTKISTDVWEKYRKDDAFKDADLLTALNMRWDWKDKGKIIPVTVEFLNAKVFIKDRAAIAEGLVNDVFPTEESAESSATPSNSSTM